MTTILESTLPVPYWISALIYRPEAVIRNTIDDKRTAYFIFPTVAPSYTAFDKAIVDTQASYIPLSPAQQERVEVALQYIASVTDLDFVATDTPERLDTLTFAFTHFNIEATAASGHPPTQDGLPRGTFLNHSDVYFTDEYASSFAFLDNLPSSLVLMHEVGHAIGLKHPFESISRLPDSENSQVWTAMSYNSDPVAHFLEYRPLDIAALHYLYGVNPFSRPGDDVYIYDQNGPNFIWDGSGTDTIDASSSDNKVTINLTPGHWGFIGDSKAETITSAGQITVNYSTVIENLIGSRFDDNLFGNEAANILHGGGGNDSLDGSGGIDTAVLTGGYQDYDFVLHSDAMQVTDSESNRDGSDMLTRIERLKFSDGSYAFDLDGAAGTIVKTLGAVFGASAAQNPDNVGLGLSLLDGGLSYDTLMDLALEVRLGNQFSHADAVQEIYTNVVGTGPSAEELDYYISLLDSQIYSVRQLAMIAADIEQNLVNVNIVGLMTAGIAYVEF